MIGGNAGMRAMTRCRKATIVALFVALLGAAHPAPAGAAGGDATKSSNLFGTDATLALTLTAPWREFVRNKSSKASYPGTLDYVDESGAKRSLPLAFSTRGHNRLKVCRFPPVKLIFEKEAVKGTPFHGNKSL